MKKFKEWPEWAQLLLCLGLPLALIAIGCGVFFGGGYYGQISGDAKKTAFTYTFDNDFEGYHKGTTVSVRKDGLEILTATNGDSQTIDPDVSGYIYFKNKKPASVKDYDSSQEIIVHDGGIAPDSKYNHTGHDVIYSKPQVYNPDNVYAVHLDKYI